MHMANDNDEFYAEDGGPPQRRFWIARDPAGGPAGSVRGWAFGYDEWRGDDWHPVWDTWERWFYQIVEYPPIYASKPLHWLRNHATETVALADLQPLFDGVRVTEGAGVDPVDLGLER